MSKLRLVALHEYKQHVLNKGFVLAIASVPLLIALILGLGVITDRMEYNGKAVGYVDYSGLLANPVAPPESSDSPLAQLLERPVSLIPYPTEDTAHTALEAGEIQAYYVLAADYRQSSQAQLVYVKPPGENATRQFQDFLQVNLLADLPPEIAHRAAEGTSMIVRAPDGSRELVEGQILSVIMPILLSILFMVLFMATSSTLVQSVVQEKENRTMEILATSLSPGHLIGGKVLAVVAMGLTLLVSWVALIGLALFFGGDILGLDWARDLRIAPQVLRTVIPAAILSYVLYSALLTALGSTVADTQESQQLGGLVALVFGLPFYATVVLIEQPNSPLAIGLTLFPLTSLTSLCLRSGFGSVPPWQLVSSLAILGLSALGAIWLAARAFRLGMLRYGQRVNWREIFRGSKSRTTGAAKAIGGK